MRAQLTKETPAVSLSSAHSSLLSRRAFFAAISAAVIARLPWLNRQQHVRERWLTFDVGTEHCVNVRVWRTYDVQSGQVMQRFDVLAGFYIPKRHSSVVLLSS